MPDRNSDVDNPERLEAQARVIMWEHSRIPHPDLRAATPRADRAAARLRLRNEFDVTVDRWAESRLLQALARISESTS